jgi:hypothetical protein
MNNLFSLLNIVTNKKSRSMNWVGHVACMRYIKHVYKLSSENRL